MRQPTQRSPANPAQSRDVSTDSSPLQGTERQTGGGLNIKFLEILPPEKKNIGDFREAAKFQGGRGSGITILKHPYKDESSWSKNIKIQFSIKIY